MAKQKNDELTKKDDLGAILDGSEVLKKVRAGEVTGDDALLDGEAIIKSLMGADEPKATIIKVVKLKPTRELPMPGIRGTFLGYEPIMVTPPQGGEPRLMNFVLLQVAPGFIVKHLGTSQIMQGLAIAVQGDTVTIVKANEPDIEIAGGRRVKVFHVLIDQSAKRDVVGYAQPFGEWGDRLLKKGATHSLLTAGKATGETVSTSGGDTADAKTGEVVDEAPAAPPAE